MTVQVAVDSNVGIPVHQCTEYTIAMRGGANERPISVSQKFNLATFPIISLSLYLVNERAAEIKAYSMCGLCLMLPMFLIRCNDQLGVNALHYDGGKVGKSLRCHNLATIVTFSPIPIVPSVIIVILS